MKQILASVVSVNTIAQDIFEMKLYAPELFEGQAVRPGMFVHMLLGDDARILRRPISIYGANPQDGQIALAIQIVGQGTRKLSEKKPGDRVDILGPLGNNFEFQDARIIYGVGGGVGISPIRFAAMSLNPGQEMEAFFGYRTQSLIYGDEGLECPVHITTDDGSAGEHGLVTAPLKRRMAERRPDGSLMPVMARAGGALGDDLAGVLKYKGKTNELFTQMLINAALYSSDFYRNRERLSFCDPLCGRGTGLYQAANRRWDALGVDMDKNDINEAQQYFKRYLEYHKIKHQFAQRSLTFQGKQCATEKSFEYYLSAADAKQKKSARLSMILADSSQMERYLKPERFHIMAADLPYGVQHAPGQRGGMASFEQMLKGALKQWLKVLKPGGALALAFNTYTLRRAALSEWMAQAGFEVMTGGAYEGFEHWVEQAVNRDVLVGKRP